MLLNCSACRGPIHHTQALPTALDLIIWEFSHSYPPQRCSPPEEGTCQRTPALQQSSHGRLLLEAMDVEGPS